MGSIIFHIDAEYKNILLRMTSDLMSYGGIFVDGCHNSVMNGEIHAVATTQFVIEASRFQHFTNTG